MRLHSIAFFFGAWLIAAMPIATATAGPAPLAGAAETKPVILNVAAAKNRSTAAARSEGPCRPRYKRVCSPRYKVLCKPNCLNICKVRDHLPDAQCKQRCCKRIASGTTCRNIKVGTICDHIDQRDPGGAVRPRPGPQTR